MKHLEELGRVLNDKKLARIEIFDNSNNQHTDNLMTAFFEGITQQRFSSDAEAARLIYGSDDKSEKYRKLKSRLNNRLLNSFLLIKPPANRFLRDETSQLNLKRQLVIIHVLKQIGATSNALKISKKALNQALLIKDHKAVIELATQIKDLATNKISFSEINKLDALSIQHHNYILIELKAKQLIQSIDYYIAEEYPSKEMAYKKVSDSIKSLIEEDITCLSESLITKLKVKRIQLALAEQKYAAVIENSLNALAGLNALKVSNSNPDFRQLQEFYYLSTLKLAEPTETLRIWNDIQYNVHLSNTTKVKLCGYFICHSLEQKQCSIAISIFNEISTNKATASIIKESDQWKAIYLYLSYCRLQSNIISPVNRFAKMPRINYYEEIKKLRWHDEKTSPVFHIHLGILKMLCSRDKNVLNQEIALLKNTDKKELPKRFATLVKLLSKWQISNFDEPKDSWARDFSILSQTNFLNSQNLNTFEPINLGRMLGDIFELHTHSGKNLVQQF